MVSQLWFASLVLAFGGALGCTVLFALATHSSAPLGFRLHANPAMPPVLGGLAILIGTVAAAMALELASAVRHLLLGMSLVFAAGLWGDITQNRALSLVAQAIAVLFAAAAAPLEVRTIDFMEVGVAGLGLALALLAVFAVMRAINAMADLPGFRAAFSFVALTWFVFAAALAGQELEYRVALLLQASIGGYLLCNFVLLGRDYRHVFLGSSGGLMVAFAIGWLALDLTQGPDRSIPLFVALWVLYLPLADGCSVLLRRIARREDLFERSDRHLHHYLKLHGMKTSAVFAAMVVVSGLCALFGFIGWRKGIPPVAMYAVAAILFVAYHAWITSRWRKTTGFVVFTQ